VRELGYRAGLHTGGAYPHRLAALLPQLDWIGFDLKTDAAGYDALTGTPGSGACALESAALVAASGVACEFRLTYHSGLMDADAVLRAADTVAALGVNAFVLQEFRRDGVADELPTHDGIDAALIEALRSRFPAFTLRGAC
jgi:pyruvate formate lyase activating enzyme